MFAHGYQKLVVNGIGRTTAGFESMSIPLAIVSASFVTVVEFVGGVMLVPGALTPVVCALMLVVMSGAAVFVHIPHGVFVANGGWELVGSSPPRCSRWPWRARAGSASPTWCACGRSAPA